MATKREATIEDLYNVPDGYKGELVDGELVLMPASGFWPSYAAGMIFASLLEYSKRAKKGFALPNDTGYIVNLPNRRSFNPDAAYYTGPTSGMKFLDRAPTFAAEVRSEWDYGAGAERDQARKRAEYFEAGTQVVWYVDLLSEDVVRVYRHADPENPTIYLRGELAEAEPAVPGWQMPVDDLFPTGGEGPDEAE